MSLFGLDIAGIVNANIAPGLNPLTLIVVTQGTRDANNPRAGRSPTEQPYAGRGIITDYRQREIDDSAIRRGDRKAVFITKSLPSSTPAPKTGDKVSDGTNTYTIVNEVTADPAGATYTCQVRLS